MNRRHIVALACGAAVLVAGCGSSSKSSSTTAASASTAASSAVSATTVATDPITITKAWARTSPSMAGAGAAYFTVVSTVDDNIVGVKVDASIAKTAEMHQTTMSMGGSDTTMAGGMSATTMAGGTATTMAPTMTMSPVDSIPLKAGTPFQLKPGAYHIMLMELVKPLEKGQTFDLTITFEKAGTRTVKVTVADEEPAS